MPTYEYVCRACDAHLEIVQRFDDEPLSSCRSCGGALRKVFGSIGIAFKGSGFYKTDNRSSVKSDKAGADKAGASEKGSSDKGGADKKGDGSTAGGKDTGGKEASGSRSSGDTASSSSPAKSDSPAKSA